MDLQFAASSIPLSSSALRELDRRAIEDFGLPGLVLMEHAGAGAARTLVSWLAREGRAPGRVAVVCGTGNNGGDGAVVARWLAAGGLDVRVFVIDSESALRGDARSAHEILARCGARARFEPTLGELERELAECDTLVDALLGTGAKGAPREPCASWIRALVRRRSEGASVAALDLPSGFDADTGTVESFAVEADLTLSFAAPKLGFARSGAERWLGELFVLPIGVPRRAYDGLAGS